MQIERVCYQHGVVTTFAHSIRVACLAVWIADRLRLWHRVDLHSLIRAALLHDYFLTTGMLMMAAVIVCMVSPWWHRHAQCRARFPSQ